VERKKDVNDVLAKVCNSHGYYSTILEGM